MKQLQTSLIRSPLNNAILFHDHNNKIFAEVKQEEKFSMIKYGKQRKFYRFKRENLDNIYTFLNKKFNESLMQKTQKKEQKEKLLDKLDTGIVLSGSWGYDQTNVEFFLVLGKDKSTITIQELSHKHISSEGYSSMSCHVIPDLDASLIGDEYKIRVTNGYGVNHPDISSCTLQIWDKKPKYKSWYA